MNNSRLSDRSISLSLSAWIRAEKENILLRRRHAVYPSGRGFIMGASILPFIIGCEKPIVDPYEVISQLPLVTTILML